MLCCGIPVMAEAVLPPDFAKEFVAGPAYDDRLELGSIVGTDGSVIDIQPIEAARVGWNAVAGGLG